MKTIEYYLIGKSKWVERLRKEIARLSKSESDVLISGEIGTGKGSIAWELHNEKSKRESQENHSFRSLNALVLDDKEFITGLFGFEKGVKGLPPTTKRGIFEHAKGGTVLIEEIEEADFRTQMKLSEFLKDRTIKRIGGSEEKQIRSRIIITVKNSLDELLASNKLYEGLYQELKKFELVETIPLRDRPEDIPHLLKRYVHEISHELGIKDVVVDINAIDVLTRHSWRENLRELKAVVDKAVLFSTGGKFSVPAELVDEKTEVVKMINNILGGQAFILDNSLDVIEKGIIERSLTKFGFNQSRAANFLGMTEQTLRYKLKRLGIVSARQR